MKKIITLAVLCSLFLLSGCGDASAEISDKKTVLFQVGKTKVTKEDFYKELLKNDGGASIITMATNYIVKQEVETTDEMTKKAQEKLEEYKKDLGDEFESSVIAAGYASVDDFFDFILTSVKADYLVDTYINDNWASLISEYSPKKARIMCFNVTESQTLEEAKEKAMSAIEEVRAGGSFATVAAKYGSDSSLANEKLYTSKDTALDVNVAQVITTAAAPTISDVTINSTATSCYVIQVTVTNEEQLKEAFSEYLKEQSTFSETVSKSYFEKYNFTVYDINAYNLLKENYSSYLIQK
ncbi:MAG: hypothetical protein IJM15_05520 [Erysipelotrichaceae bacterium]|nr:hypothetical protein [Erysipelotrichaceae bacterium]